MKPAPDPDRAPDVDARGLKCPLPVIHLARLARELPSGTTVLTWADDPAAEADIPAWARMRGHVVTVERQGAHTAYTVVLG
ncbi:MULTISPECIES: sulfurtransferase TusA family protein [unclassified Knoellia]|uniref:sulfurtransferase TusA family protein n=1 Tax=Knoellia altitudinis TaxID=3404795 RepID=UPI0036204CF2